MRVHSKRYWRLCCGALLAGLLLMPAVAQACAVCWSAEDPLSRGLFWSVIFLMAAPFTIGASVFGFIYVSKRGAGHQPPADPQLRRAAKES